MKKSTIQHFYTASLITHSFRWRGQFWYQAEISLYKVGGGYQKTEEEYRALIDVWNGRGNGRNQEVYIDECLFTFDEVVAMRRYFLALGNRWCGSFRAMLFLDYPIHAHLIGPSSPSAPYKCNSLLQIHFYNAPNYPLEFRLMGSCKFRGMTKEEKQEAKSIQVELAADNWRMTVEELKKEKAYWAAERVVREARLDAEEVAFHGPCVKLAEDAVNDPWVRERDNIREGGDT